MSKVVAFVPLDSPRTQSPHLRLGRLASARMTARGGLRRHSGFPPALILTARLSPLNDGAERPTAPRAVILELARESSLYFFAVILAA